jgi:hypothetical protein
MSISDDDFRRLLHKQLADDLRDKNLTTMNALKRRQTQQKPSSKSKPKPR